MSNTHNQFVSRHLGKQVKASDHRDPSLLVAEPRSSNRLPLGIQDNDLPFYGYDIWNAYEVSALCNNGTPVIGIVRIKYKCESKYIVESKSLKLYFNSFNMHKCGDTANDVRMYIKEAAEEDLTHLLKVKVSVDIRDNTVFTGTTNTSLLGEFDTLESHITTVTDVYEEHPNFLSDNLGELPNSSIYKLHSGLLRSNCRVTAAPDFGDVFLYLKTKQIPPLANILKYIISFRNECHFHEEVCETIFKRFYDIIQPEELLVMCLYTRRGGIDINPCRYTPNIHLHLSEIIDSCYIHPAFKPIKTGRQ